MVEIPQCSQPSIPLAVHEPSNAGCAQMRKSKACGLMRHNSRICTAAQGSSGAVAFPHQDVQSSPFSHIFLPGSMQFGSTGAVLVVVGISVGKWPCTVFKLHILWISLKTLQAFLIILAVRGRIIAVAHSAVGLVCR